MNSKRKGKIGELEWASFLRDHGWIARRGVQYQGGIESPDVVDNSGWHWEVKRVERLDLKSACAQAEGECQGRPWAVAHRTNHGPWFVTLTAERFMDLLTCWSLDAAAIRMDLEKGSMSP